MEATCEVLDDDDALSNIAGGQRLSRGQKKKLRQREAKSAPVSMQAQCAEGAPNRRHLSCASSSPSLSSISESLSDTDNDAQNLPSDGHDGDKGEIHRGLFVPPRLREISWPSQLAEHISLHEASRLPALAEQRLRLAALPFPQPKDQLQWRILPLVRNALALTEDGEELTLSELATYVEGHLPAACLLRITSARLRALVELVVMRNVRCGRLRQRGKRFTLPPSEDVRLLVPNLVGMKLEALWVAWGTELKRPVEAVLHYICAPEIAPKSPPVWLCAEFSTEDESECAPGNERVLIGGVATHFEGCSSLRWVGSSRWRLHRTSDLAEDLVLDFARQVIEQDTMGNG